jgi:8-oxo-dGTP pyrophosphatase MutT (NUDIX family)
MSTMAWPEHDGDWPDLAARRLLPLAGDPDLAPANIDSLTAWWGGPRPLRPAAVLVGLVPRAQGVHVLLTRRHDDLARHGGQISFPGGRIDRTDADAVQAALRETEEEVGVGAGLIRPLGRIEPLATVSEYLVQPIVAWIDPAYQLRLQASEVTAAFELPLRRAAQPELWQPCLLSRPGLGVEMKSLDFQGHTIWGATAMIINRLLQRLGGLPL